MNDKMFKEATDILKDEFVYKLRNKKIDKLLNTHGYYI